MTFMKTFSTDVVLYGTIPGRGAEQRLAIREANLLLGWIVPGQMTSTLHIYGLHRSDDRHAADAAQYALLPFTKAVKPHLDLTLLHL